MSHDTYKTPDGHSIRMIGENILIKVDETPDRVGLIHLPTGAMTNVTNTATILAYGYKYTSKKVNGAVVNGKIPIPGLEPGLKCLFVRFLAEQDSNKQLQRRIEEGVIRIKPDDILLVFPPSEADRVR